MKKAFATLKWLSVAAGFAYAWTACSQSTYPDRSARIVDSAVVDTVVFWPPGPRYLVRNDTMVVELRGLRRGLVCATVLEAGLETELSNTDSLIWRARARVELPASPVCALDPTGVDTSLRMATTHAAPARIYLKTHGVRTDSAWLVSGTAQSQNLIATAADSGSVTLGRFVFHDSTALHPARVLKSDSLRTCEALQAAVFTRSADTVRVRFRVVQLAAAGSQASLPPCSGPHSDSIAVAVDRFGFPDP